ncbi:hypothetical protein ILUMI_20242 [Ignelater luminosus]|uniref:Uncharacterized protein n=1 Tax=Ignelater luminosus TaxID=2038154 RepID=A0A8K0CEK2_IGNLU|nr:hypothetical protein ILUMI_20242 [Ignelater luminosus]
MRETISIYISNTPRNRQGKERKVFIGKVEHNVNQLRISSNTKKLKPTNKKRCIETKAAEGNVSRAIRLFSSEDNLAQKNEDAYNCLLEKHKALVFTTLLLTTTERHTPFTVTTDDVFKPTFSTGFPAGIDGLRPQHLKDLLFQNTAELKIVPRIPRGPRITVALKLTSTTDNCIAHNTTQTCEKLFLTNLLSEFKPRQLDFSVLGGVEVIVHSTRSFLNNFTAAEILVKIDPSDLFYDDRIVPSSSRCLQEDLAGPVISSLDINETMKSFMLYFIVRYLDDGVLAGTCSTVVEDLRYIIESLKKITLILNPEKCKVVFLPFVSKSDEMLQQLNQVFLGIFVTQIQSLVLLGASIFNEAIPETLDEKEIVLSRSLEGLENLHPHIALYLLRHYIWILRLTYFLRRSPFFKFH